LISGLITRLNIAFLRARGGAVFRSICPQRFDLAPPGLHSICSFTSCIPRLLQNLIASSKLSEIDLREAVLYHPRQRRVVPAFHNKHRLSVAALSHLNAVIMVGAEIRRFSVAAETHRSSQVMPIGINLMVLSSFLRQWVGVSRDGRYINFYI
jgi:hypothetical protein